MLTPIPVWTVLFACHSCIAHELAPVHETSDKSKTFNSCQPVCNLYVTHQGVLWFMVSSLTLSTEPEVYTLLFV
ncbi:hypothetical protein EV424DRAFT_1415583 [Suillus variegatus]|nr:hypothetical protein EV424DRAFT_1415583 [Suillus variegatus]